MFLEIRSRPGACCRLAGMLASKKLRIFRIRAFAGNKHSAQECS